MILVEIRCRVCRAKLDEVADPAPPAGGARWSDYVLVHVCPRHGGGSRERAGWIAAQMRLGRPHDRVPVGRYVRWEELRPAVEAARRTGHTYIHRL